MNLKEKRNIFRTLKKVKGMQANDWRYDLNDNVINFGAYQDPFSIYGWDLDKRNRVINISSRFDKVVQFKVFNSMYKLFNSNKKNKKSGTPIFASLTYKKQLIKSSVNKSMKDRDKNEKIFHTHAEYILINSIKEKPLEDYVLWISYDPCYECAKFLLENTNIRRLNILVKNKSIVDRSYLKPFDIKYVKSDWRNNKQVNIINDELKRYNDYWKSRRMKRKEARKLKNI